MNTVFLFHKRSKNRNVIDTKATPMEMSQQNFIVSVERPMLATLLKPRICKPFARLRSHESIYKAKIFQGAKGIPQDRTRANNKWVSRSVKSVFRTTTNSILYNLIWLVEYVETCLRLVMTHGNLVWVKREFRCIWKNCWLHNLRKNEIFAIDFHNSMCKSILHGLLDFANRKKKEIDNINETVQVVGSWIALMRQEIYS